MKEDSPPVKRDTINNKVNSRNLKFRRHRRVKPSPTTMTTSINKPRGGSSEPLSLKRDKIVKTKYTVTNDLKHRLRKDKEFIEPIVDTPEFKLLCKLFVPPKYLIHNDKITTRQLFCHLLSLIPDNNSSSSHSSLNFELHLLLSTITTHYITSWYSTKLNTDNLEFVRNVYTILCNFTKDFIRRLRIILLTGFLLLIDELCLILNHHIEDLVSSHNNKSGIKIFDEYFKSNMNRNTIKNANQKAGHIFMKYLSDNHIIFENSDLENYHETIPENLSYTQKLESQRLLYFRIISKKILITSFESNVSSDYISASPSTSHITMSLLTILTADLIFDKVFEKLSSPQVLLDLLVRNVADSIGSSLYDNRSAEPEKKVDRSSTIGNLIYTSYNNISYFILNMHRILDTYGTYNSSNIVQSSFFQLINTITDFSNRKPLLASFINFTKRIIMKNKSITRIIDSISKWFIYNKVERSEVFSDEFGCKILSCLRENILNDERNKLEVIDVETMNLKELSNRVFDVLLDQLPSSIFLGTKIAKSLQYSNETDEDLIRSIYNFLTIFNYNISSTDNNLINDKCLLNQLLIIKFIDCIISNLYPELVNN